jgi:cyclase
MIRTRVIPSLLLSGKGFVKTTQFKNPVYLGDSLNILKIFNEKGVDEICVLDIEATKKGQGPRFDFLEQLASECFIPLAYGGGVTRMKEMKKLFYLGFEKVVLNTTAIVNPELISEASTRFGSQSVLVSIDVRKQLFGGYKVITECGRKKTSKDPVSFAIEVEKLGAGEIILNSIDMDGTMKGYDLELVSKVTGAVSIPVVACGGAGAVSHLGEVVNQGGASAAAAGSIFVFKGPHKAVLISYPGEEKLKEIFP